MSGCVVVKGHVQTKGRQGLTYFEGVSAESAGSQGICIHTVVFPPLARAYVHMHERHETAIYVLEGQAEMLYGPELDQHLKVGPGDFLYIPAGMPHMPFNPSPDAWAKGIVARTDPNQLESIVLLPDLEANAQKWLSENGCDGVQVHK